MKIGLFFGSFNPVHVGHMVLANYMLANTDLEKIWFVVSPQNPFKEKQSLLDERQRLYMVTLAIGDNNKMKASNIEFKLPQPSYTINTLAHLQEKYPQHTFALLLGADNVKHFHKWKNYEEIVKHHPLYIYPRLGSTSKTVNEQIIKYKEQFVFVDAPVIELSSTFIRQSIKEKKDVRYFMPDAVAQYVREMNFYKK